MPLDDRSILARFHAFINFVVLNSTYYLALHGLIGLSRDPNRTAFSSLSETRTHLFEVAATETGLVPATTTLEYIDYSFPKNFMPDSQNAFC